MSLFNKKKKNNTRNYNSVDNSKVRKNNYYRSPVGSSNNLKATPNEKENPSRFKIKYSLSTFINFLIILCGLSLAVFATTLNNNPIIEVSSSENLTYDINEYENASKDILNSNIFNRSKILFQQDDFETKLKDEFPEINTVNANVPIGGRSLAVFLSLAEPFANVSSGQQKVIINSEGVLVKTNIDTNDNNLLNVRFTIPQENFEQGSRVLTTTEVNLLKILNDEMTNLKFKDGSNAEIQEVLFNVADGQLEAKLKQKPFFIKLSSFNEGDIQVGGAVATLKQLDREDSLPLEYIDARVPGRVFVK
jgi:hypothetical protein